jgi:hypothetical protein
MTTTAIYLRNAKTISTSNNYFTQCNNAWTGGVFRVVDSGTMTDYKSKFE